jgi:RNA-binding protein
VELTAKQRQFLRALGHAQKPVVQIGAKGMGETLFEQIRAQLLAHELVKIRFNTESTVEPEDAQADILMQTSSQLVQRRGRTLLLYRRRDHKPSIELPKRVRATRSANG